MKYLVKCIYVNKDSEGNETYHKGNGVTCYCKESAEDYYEYLSNRDDTRDVTIEEIK